MAFQVSPGVNVSEIDLTTIVPSVATTEAAFVGYFVWGPVMDIELISDELKLIDRFGKPTDENFVDFFCAANFLSYGNALRTVRVVGDAARNANATASANVRVNNLDDYTNQVNTPALDNCKWLAKYPGVLGNSVKVSICPSADAYSKAYTGSIVNGTTVFLARDVQLDLTPFTPSLDLTNTILTADAVDLTLAGPNEVTTSDLVVRIFGGSIETRAVSSVVFNSPDTEITVASAFSGNTGTFLVFRPVLDHTDSALVGSIIRASSGTISGEERSVVSVSASNLTISSAFSSSLSSVTLNVMWEYKSLIRYALGTSEYVANRGGSGDEMHVVIVDEDGLVSGIPGTVLETYALVSAAKDAKREDGASNYYAEVVSRNSKYVLWENHPADAVNWGSNALNTAFAYSSDLPTNYSFSGGVDAAPSVGDKLLGFDLFKDPERIDISLVICGDSGADSATVAQYVINNICEFRKDCVALVSPERDDVVATSSAAENIIAFRNNLPSSSYAVLDSGWKYQFDKYNDAYRWIPLCADIAGLMVRTDFERDAWWSPAGFNRGNIKNVTKLAFNPGKAERDDLYQAGVNPVVTFPGQGTVLFGDKTLLAKPSAFDRINVRRLFIVLEKAIARAARFSLFEFNDEATRSRTRVLVEGYLKDVTARRGITDFYVVCDTRNNTSEVIDRNELVCDIYIKPARSINFIQLNFIAVRTGVQFNEIVGKF